jgi:hypothetical protein
MTLVSTVTVGAGGAASIEFTGIPGTATDLLLVLSGRVVGAADYTASYFRVNGSTSTFSSRHLAGTGSSVSSTTGGTGSIEFSLPGSTATASTFGNVAFYMPNYAGSTNKTFSIDGVTERNATNSIQRITAGQWATTSAITSVTVLSDSDFVQYSTASLYTITKGSGGATVS